MHARTTWPVRGTDMAQNAWYPATIDQGGRMNVQVDGGNVMLVGAPTHLETGKVEASDRKRRRASWGTLANTSIAVCPAGHHNEDVQATDRVFRCAKCDRVYELEA